VLTLPPEETDNSFMRSSWIRYGAAVLVPLAVVLALVILIGGDDGGSSETNSTPAVDEEPTARSEYSNIFVLDIRTRKIDRLTANKDERFADFPTWSRSGKLVYSQSDCEGCAAKLFKTSVSGSNKTRIPSDVANTFQPSLSPDQRRIAIAKPGAGIYVINVRTGRAKRLTRSEADEAPAWSPDGRQILFHRQVTATNWDIFSVRPTGGPLRRLTRDPGQQLHPAWSPDGRKVAFAQQDPTGNWVIYTMNRDGSDRERVTSEKDSSQDPVWSPDGTRLAFVAQTAPRESVALIRLDGSGRTTVTGNRLAVTSPSWSPDGRRIAFAAKDVGSQFAH
jgi:TolB protein